jgi:hypothetical protein
MLQVVPGVPGGPIAKIGPFTEPNEAVATEAQMENWFTLEWVRSKELQCGDGCGPWKRTGG